MVNFGKWLHDLQTSDAFVTSLKAFATANAASWPYWSDAVADYRQVIATAAPANRDDLLMGLAGAFQQWTSEQATRQPTAWGENLGRRLLALAAIAFAFAVAYGLWRSEFFSSLAKIEQARGLITFLFTFAAMVVIMVIAFGIFWLDVEEVKDRYASAKDLLTIVIGILGTIMGFYFGSQSSERAQMPVPFAISNFTAAQPSDNKIKVAGTITGGTAPYQYSITFTDPKSVITISNVNNEKTADGTIAKDLTVTIKGETTLQYTVTAQDAKGSKTQPISGTVAIPAPAVPPTGGQKAAPRPEP